MGPTSKLLPLTEVCLLISALVLLAWPGGSPSLIGCSCYRALGSILSCLHLMGQQKLDIRSLGTWQYHVGRLGQFSALQRDSTVAE